MPEEKDILSFWKEKNIFKKSVLNRQTRGKKNFVFFEGPPTANGNPGVHHVESRAFKDVILRYKTMRGYHVPRRAGWDTHGLPVEVQVEKELGLKSKKDIEKYGIAEFNRKCRESVWRYKELWEELTEKMGFWIDMENAYVTYANYYIESLWAVIKEFTRKKLLYEDFKVMPWCTRCGTALSSHELAQGYGRVKEKSIYVKFPVKGEANTFFLVWTTTPWTLPGNVALAINSKVDYVYAQNGKETLILGEALFEKVGEGYEIKNKVKGSELVGRGYEPLYPASGVNLEASIYKVMSGEFVSTDDGTGIVHIAPAFGDDDFKLSQVHDLPILVTVTEDGNMDTPGKPWDKKFFKNADKLIGEDLISRGLFFKSETYEHDYPFCWRCNTPLMYLARQTWWVDVNKVRPKMIKNNKKINWLPTHIKEGRFGEWLKEKKNWAFSRERYWGTPLPVWRCKDCNKWETMGSIDELAKRAENSGNKYVLMRHGEAEHITKKVANSSLEHNIFELTKKGVREVQTSALKLKKAGIKPDLVFTSPFLRTRQTAEILTSSMSFLGKIAVDARLSEINTGVFAEKPISEYRQFFKSPAEKFDKPPPQGETLLDMKNRVWNFISETDAKFAGKTIIIVTHEDALWMLWSAFLGKDDKEALEEKMRRGKLFIKTAEYQIMNLPNIPRDENLVLDLHKPYIDRIRIKCACGGEMQRVKEVVDVWFDSGAMPFALAGRVEYPADYIVEAVDQTRGWFYTLLAVGTLLGKAAPYKNVISLGHVLDANGKKMSKSLGNIAEPLPLVERYGADAVRWYFFTVNQPWDSKLFKEEDIKDAQRRFFNILLNSVQFWKLYGEKGKRKDSYSWSKTGLLINKWILMRLGEVVGGVTHKLDSYDIVGAARELEYFVTEDLSRWYIRRIRDVMKANSKEAQETNEVLRLILLEVSKLLAPFAPFSSEHIYKELYGKKESVHLDDWSVSIKVAKSKSEGTKILEGMKEVRAVVSLALEARAKAGIKVRQPLGSLTINKKIRKLNEEFNELIKAEVNVKNIEYTELDDADVKLDTFITPGLKEEGIFRDLVREIQSSRKKAGLKPENKASADLKAPADILYVADKCQDDLKKETNLRSISLAPGPGISVDLQK